MNETRSKPDFESYALTHGMSGQVTAGRKRLLDSLITPDMRVLDIGCGDGRHLDYLAARVPRERLQGTEISRIRCERVQARGYACAKVEGEGLPFPDGSFDAVILFEVLEHLSPEAVPGLLKEICRVLAPDGVLLGSTPNYPAKRFWDLFTRLGRHLRLRSRGAGAQGEPALPDPRRAAHPAESRRAGLRGKLERLLADDPTHQFRCDVGIIGRLGRSHFHGIERYTSINGREREVRGWHPRNWITHKVFFVFRGPRKAFPADGAGR